MTGTSPTAAHRPGPHRDYATAYRAAHEEPERFWAAAVRAVGWIHRPARELDGAARGFGHWYRGGDLNACFNALDRHVIAGRADETALLVDAFGDGEPTTYSYADLLDLVARFAGVLQVLEVGPGDRVLVELPARAETVIAMLACARIGAVHVLVDGDLSAGELAARLTDACPVVTIGPASEPDDGWPRSGRSRLAEAIERSAHRPAQRIVVGRPPGDTDPVGGELDWAVLMRADTVPPAACAPVPAGSPLYLLYPDRPRSGSPAEALAQDLADNSDDVAADAAQLARVVSTTGAYVTGLSAAMREVYGLGPGDVLVSTAALATPAGHLAAVYGPLLAGATTVLVDGAPAGDDSVADLAQVLTRHDVDAVLASADDLDRVDGVLTAAPGRLAKLRAVILTGGALNPDAAAVRIGVPVVDDYAGDLIAGAITGTGTGDTAGSELPDSAVPGGASVTGNSSGSATAGRSDFGWRRE